MEQKKTFNPLAYTICIRMNHGMIEVSQPDFEIYEAVRSFQDIRNGKDIGELVLSVMDKVRKTHADLTKERKDIPPPSSPKGALNLPLVHWVGITEAAKFLNVSESTVRRLCNGGVIEAKKSHSGRRILWKTLQNYKSSGGVPHYETPQQMQGLKVSKQETKLSFFEALLSPKKDSDQTTS